MPPWLEALEQEAFETPWGALAPHEHLFAIPADAYIRWAVVPAASEAELLRIAVAPSARRQGHARQLMTFSEAFLRSQSIRDAYLEVRVSNVAARTLYESQGWSLQRLRPGYYADGEDAAIYGKVLS